MSLPNYFSVRVFPVVRKDFPTIPSHWKNPVVYGKTKGKVSIRCDHWVIITHLIDGCPRLPEVLKEAIHTPDMGFTFISVSQLNDMKCSATFSSGMCTIRNPSGCTMVTIPCANGLHCVTAVNPLPPTMWALQWSRWLSVKPTRNLVTLHLWLSSMQLQRVTSPVSSSTLSWSPNSVRHVPRPKQLGNPSQRNWKLVPWST